MLRYDYEYLKEMSNLTWKDHLGLRTVEATSFFIRYRSILGHDFLMFFMQLVVLLIILFVQVFFRLTPFLDKSPYATTAEHVFIVLIAFAEFIFSIWLMLQIKETDDNFFLKQESKRIFVLNSVAGILWIIGLCISATNLNYIWIKTAGTLLVTTWICVYCYYETLWVINQCKIAWAKHDMRQATVDGSSLRMRDVLQIQEGFEAMMRFLVKEFSCENLLAYVEVTQYLQAAPKYAKKLQQTAGLLSDEELVNMDPEDHSMPVSAMRNMVDSQSNSPSDRAGHFSMDDLGKYGNNELDKFSYFQPPKFFAELDHFEYIMQKYIYDSATLQINISSQIRLEAAVCICLFSCVCVMCMCCCVDCVSRNGF